MAIELLPESENIEHQYERLYEAYLDQKEEILRLKKQIKMLKKNA